MTFDWGIFFDALTSNAYARGAMTASGIAWMIMARFWGGLSDRRGARRLTA